MVAEHFQADTSKTFMEKIIQGYSDILNAQEEHMSTFFSSKLRQTV